MNQTQFEAVSYEVQHFKGFGGAAAVELKPLTLIYGANSSGKSSLLQPALLLKQTIDESRDQRNVILIKGTLTNGGSFRDLIHRHEETGEFSVRIEFPCQIFEEWCRKYDLGSDIGSTLFTPPARISVRFRFSHDPRRGRVVLSGIEVYLDGETSPNLTYRSDDFVWSDSDTELPTLRLSDARFDKPLWRSLTDSHHNRIRQGLRELQSRTTEEREMAVRLESERQKLYVRERELRDVLETLEKRLQEQRRRLAAEQEEVAKEMQLSPQKSAEWERLVKESERERQKHEEMRAKIRRELERIHVEAERLHDSRQSLRELTSRTAKEQDMAVRLESERQALYIRERELHEELELLEQRLQERRMRFAAEQEEVAKEMQQSPQKSAERHMLLKESDAEWQMLLKESEQQRQHFEEMRAKTRQELEKIRGEEERMHDSRRAESKGNIDRRTMNFLRRVIPGFAKIAVSSQLLFVLDDLQQQLKSESIDAVSNFVRLSAAQRLVCQNFLPTQVVTASDQEGELEGESFPKANIFWYLSMHDLTVKLCKAVGQFLDQLAYVGPLRRMPERLYVADSLEATEVGKTGDLAPEILFRNSRFLADFNKVAKSFGLGYTIRVSPLAETVFVLELVDSISGVTTNFADVGFGISQTLPVLVQTLLARNKTVMIEQPELHLHPRLQAELADVFIASTTQPYGNKFLIETHSEHIMLRLQRRIREGTLDSSNVAVYFIDHDQDGSQCLRLRLDSRGNFLDAWPGGFFEETYKEVFS
jgi:hypothetical protein